MVDIIYYGYEMAPNPQKLLQFLKFLGISFNYVEIPELLPRPDFESVGIGYRRSPLLSIDSDMYVDTSLIISKLCDIASHSAKSGVVDATNHVEFFHLGEQIFKCAVGLLPATHPLLQDAALVKDRGALHGGSGSFSVEQIVSARPSLLNRMSSYLSLLQRSYLHADNKFVLGGDAPTTADMYLYWSVNWGLKYHDGTRPEISESTHPLIFNWLDRVESFLESRKQSERTSMSFEVAREILVRPPKHEYAKFVHHDENNVFGLQVGQNISVTPEDSGKTHPQYGTLIAFNADQICLRNEKNLVMHFPNIGYTIAAI